MSSTDLRVMTVQLTGQPDDTNTCFNAVEVEFIGSSARSPATLVKKPNGFEGVVYSKHPINLKHRFGRGFMLAELNEGPQSVYYIYPSGEEVDSTELVKQLPPIIKQEFPLALTIINVTQRYASYTDAPDCAFFKEFSSHWVADANHNVVLDKSFYKPGCVVNTLFNKDGKTLFTSIFVGVEIIKYRLAVLGSFFADEELKTARIQKHEDDKVLEEGEFKLGADPVADAAKIIKWMKMLVGKV